MRPSQPANYLSSSNFKCKLPIWANATIFQLTGVIDNLFPVQYSTDRKSEVYYEKNDEFINNENFDDILLLSLYFTRPVFYL